ncbi:MAG: type 2 isopentenyl-diphosphate Delta-isomerase [Deltaproteobacteria bacterium]|nr:type 2 isopentenyl-diphosphate Delta-isomerase [Deltaproteobacteria bacterium]
MDDRSFGAERRKQEHLAPFRKGGVAAREATTWLECVRLVHCALPDLSVADVDLSTSFAGRTLRAPLFVTGMTGGTPEARLLNAEVARVAGRLGIGFGLGSQRAMIVDPGLAPTYEVRAAAPDVFLAGNIGGVQLASLPLEAVARMLETVGADALCVHLNPAQELVQPEGDRDFRGVLDAIRRAVRGLPVPVIVKEVGAGISRETAIRLRDAGVRCLDVAGVGGTSWVGVEAVRRGSESDPELRALWDWGLPTAAAVAEVADLGLEVIASGGIRTGVEAARALALGASVAGVAAPVASAWFEGGEEAVERVLSRMIDGVRAAFVLTGSRSLADLRAAPRIVTGPLREWIEARTPGRPPGRGQG